MARTRTTGCLHICANTKRGTRLWPRFDVLPSGNAVPLPAHASLFFSESTRCHFFLRLLPSIGLFSFSFLSRTKNLVASRRRKKVASKRHARRKQTRRRPANAILSRPTDRFVSSFRTIAFEANKISASFGHTRAIRCYEHFATRVSIFPSATAYMHDETFFVPLCHFETLTDLTLCPRSTLQPYFYPSRYYVHIIHISLLSRGNALICL